MHEWSLASGVIETVTDESSKRNATAVKQVDILVGEISQIEIPIFKDALENLKTGTVLDGCEISIEVENTKLKCRSCGNEFGFPEVRDKLEPLSEGGDNPVHYLPASIAAFVGCPECSSPNIMVTEGSGVRINKIVMDVED